MEFQYFNKIIKNLEVVREKERDNILKLTDLLYKTVKGKKSIYIYGSGHAGIISQEMFYRAGGFMLFNPIFPRESSLDNEPITLTSKIERLEGYGRVIAMKADFKPEDVLIIHSVSGRNSAGIDMAFVAKEKGVKLVAITNLKYSKSVSSRHSSKKNLYEIVDLVIDNHGEIGDAISEIEGSDQRVAASSTIIATAILSEAITQLAQKMVDDGVGELPFFHSANMEGGDEANKRLYEKYKSQIHYRFN